MMAGTTERICVKFARRRVWSFARISLNVKVKGQGHQGQKARCALTTPGAVDGKGRPRYR